MAGNLKQQSDEQPAHLPATMPDHGPRPLDKPPPDLSDLGAPGHPVMPPDNERPCR